MFIATKDIFATAYTAYYESKDAMRRLIDDFKRTQDILREARDQIAQGFDYFREDK